MAVARAVKRHVGSGRIPSASRTHGHCFRDTHGCVGPRLSGARDGADAEELVRSREHGHDQHKARRSTRRLWVT